MSNQSEARELQEQAKERRDRRAAMMREELGRGGYQPDGEKPTNPPKTGKAQTTGKPVPICKLTGADMKAINAIGPRPNPPGGSTPSQYALPPWATELQHLIEHRRMNFAVGNIFKAAYRLGSCEHSDRKRDLNKIVWFAEAELARIEREESGNE